MRKAAFVLVTVVLACLVVMVCVELVAVAMLFFQDGVYISARERFRGEADTFVAGVTRSRGCQLIDSLFPHPYLGFVHHRNPPCGVPWTNNIGLFGEDYPSESIRDRFVVLVTGGSVAAQFAQMYPQGPRHLEIVLNATYASPTGKPFLVLNGGDGAWKQPQQTILFLLYSDVVDAVVTLDGFNEHYLLGSDVRFEYPANNFMIVNPFAGDPYGVMIARWMVGRAIGYVNRSTVLSHSSAAFALLRGARRLTEGVALRGERPTTVRGLFKLPEDWSEERRTEWPIAQYKKYIRALNAIARDRGVLAASFIQPVPAIGKRLTPEEQRVAGDLGYGPRYQRMTDSLLTLRSDGLRVFSLLEIFRGVEATLYVDHAHLAQDGLGDSVGYRMMAEEMARRLAESWGLKRKG